MSQSALVRQFSRTLLSQQLENLPDRQLLDRFINSHDADAFAAIMERHAALVYGVCRRVVQDSHQAEDIFQATFLLLARKARSLRQSELLANWLFGVARRLSLKVQAKRERIAKLERQAAALKHEAQSPRPWDEPLRILDEELQRLPACYRRPLMACYLRELTQEDAAKSLGLSVRTLRRRLTNGKELLRTRLATRGAGLSILVAAATAMTAKVDANVIDRAKEAVLFGSIRPEVATLAAQATQLTTAFKLRLGLVALLTVSALVGGFAKPRTPQVPAVQPKPMPKLQTAERRDRFNDPLPPGAIARLGTISLQHAGPVERLAFSPDGKELMSAGHGVLRRWQIETGHEIDHFDFREINRPILGCCLTDDWKNALVVYGNPNQLDPLVPQVYDVASRQRIHDFSMPRRFNATVDGYGRLLTANSEKLEAWDILTGQSKFSVPFKSSSGSVGLFANANNLLASYNGEFHVFDLTSGRKITTFGKGTPGYFSQRWYSGDGKWLITQSYELGEPKPARGNLSMQEMIPDKSLRIWNAEKGEVVGSLPLAPYFSYDVTFTPDSKTFLVVAKAATDGFERSDIQWWDVATRTLKMTWPNDLTSIANIAISRDQKLLAAASVNGSIRIWNVTDRKEISHLESHECILSRATFSPNGEKVRTLGHDEELIDWDSASGKPIRRWHEMKKTPGMFNAYTSDLRYRVSAEQSPTGRITIWDVEKNRVLHDLRAYQRMRTIYFSHNDRRVTLVFEQDQQSLFQTYDMQTGKLLIQFEVGVGGYKWFTAYPISDDTSLIVYSDLVIGVNAQTGQERFKWKLSGQDGLSENDVRSCMISPSPDGRTVACTLPQVHSLQLRELETGKLIRILPVDPEQFTKAFSPDSRYFATVTNGIDPAIVVWDLKTGQKKHEFTTHSGTITCLQFSPDGKRLLSANEDCTALIWQIEP